MFSISICNLQETVAIDEGRLDQVIRDSLDGEQVASAELSVAVVDDERMRELNRTHLGHDYPTDVLSFLLECESGPDPAPAGPEERPGRGKRLDGELVISAETAQRQAREYGWDANDELLLYAVHGVLHLCGYEDSTDADRERMQRRQSDILQIRGLTPHYELSAR